MTTFPDFFGNEAAARALRETIESGRIPQTILLSGPEGIGKATLARRFAGALLGDPEKIEKDDLSRPENLDTVEEREKWPAEKRTEDPLLFSSHPDFVTFAPDGPLRQISIQQMRVLRERAVFKPHKGRYRVFLIDHLERAPEQSANSLLKVLEEPPEHLIIIATVENLFDLLPTIRSRSVVLQMSRLQDDELRRFVDVRELDNAEMRIAISEGSPGTAASLDIETYRERRELLLTGFEYAADVVPFSRWVAQSEPFSARKSEKLDFYLKLAYSVLEDTAAMSHGRAVLRNRDVADRIRAISERINFAWLEQAVRGLDELVLMARRNIQKMAALDAMIINLRNRANVAST